MKQLPDVKMKQHKNLMNKSVDNLERKLSSLVARSLKKSFTPFRDDLIEGQSK